MTEQPAPAAVPAPLDDKLAKLGVAAQGFLYQLDQYMNDMRPGMPQEIRTGAQRQVLLYRTLQGIINHAEDDFEPLFDILLQRIVDNYDGVFGPSMVMRFMAHVALSKADQEAFLRFINFLHIMAFPGQREVGKQQLDFTALLSHGVTDTGRRNVLAYFGL